MLNLFQLSPNDQSIYYLGHIFGAVGNVLPAQSVTDSTLIFGVMFKVLNTIALTAGAFIITYVTVVGLLKTASEGEFLGKHWQSLWVPIRMVMGTAALFPAASGYSLIQIAIMWMVLQGIGAADTLWASVLNYAKQAGSIYSYYSPPTSQITSQMESLFDSLVCQETIRAKYPDIDGTATSGNKFYWYCGHDDNSSSDYCKQTDEETYNVIDGQQVTGQETDTLTYTMGNGNCGTLTYANPLSTKTAVCQVNASHDDWGPDSLKCLSYKGQQQALSTIVPVLAAIAKQYVQTDYEYVSFYETPATPPGGMNASGQINNSQDLQFTDNNGNSTQPASWISNYCTAPSSANPPGLGLTPNQCCVTPRPPSGSKTGCATSSFPLDYYKMHNTSDYTNGAPDAIQKAYLPFSVQPYLGSNLDFIDTATNQFIQQGLSGPYQNWITTLPPPSFQSGDAGSIAYASMYQDGWLMAGSYYFNLTKSNQKAIKAVDPTLKVALSKSGSTDSYTRLNTTAASFLLNAINGSGSDSGALASTGLGSVAPVKDPVQGASADVITDFIKNISVRGGRQPIVLISTFGFRMMATVQFLFLAIPATYAVFLLLATFNPMVMGWGLTTQPIGEVVKAVFSFFGPFYVALLAALFSIGALLGIYVPLIPFIIYTVTGLGWFIATIEAMIAAPLIALGILSPGGQHEIMGRAEASIMILFNLILRPTLMVIGLIAGMVLSSQIINFLNVGFDRVAGSILPTVGLIEQIVFMAIYVNLLMIIVNKSFSLIHEIPARATMYMGGHQISFGEAEATGQAQRAAEGAAAGMSRGAQRSAAGSMAGMRQAHQKKMKGQNQGQQNAERVVPGGGAPPAAEAKGEEGEEKEE